MEGWFSVTRGFTKHTEKPCLGVARSGDVNMVSPSGSRPDDQEMKLPNVAIVGATGAVGVEMLLCLEPW